MEGAIGNTTALKLTKRHVSPAFKRHFVVQLVLVG